MGNVSMEARDINYRGGETKMSVEEALKSASGEAAAIAQLQTDVGNLQTTKANLITIAPVFSAETAYDPGDLVYYNGLTYRCVNAHEGEWDADDFAATTIANELGELKSGLTDVNSKLTMQDLSVTLNESIGRISFYAKRMGDVVYVSSQSRVLTDATISVGSTIISGLPKPAISLIDVPAFNDNGLKTIFYLGSDGNLYNRTSLNGGDDVYYNFSYVCSDN